MLETTTFHVNEQNGLLEGVEYCKSPHCDVRPEGVMVDMIVIHGISLPPGEFGGNAIQAFFSGKLDKTSHPYFNEIGHLRVSAHLLIKRTGDIIQFVPFHQRAWHAGESFFDGRAQCNDFSIGIELEGTDTLPYEIAQYEQLALVIESLLEAYPLITRDRLLGHCDVAPGRKTDPGPLFDWTYLKGKLT